MSEKKRERGTILHPNHWMAEGIDNFADPFRHSVKDRLRGIPLIGGLLAELTDWALALVQAAMVLDTYILRVGIALAKGIGSAITRPWRSSEKKRSAVEELASPDFLKDKDNEKEAASEEKKQEQASQDGPTQEATVQEQTAEANREQVVADEMRTFEDVERTLNNDENEIPDLDNLGHTNETVQPVQEQTPARERQTEAAQRTLHYSEQQMSVFKKSPKDVYAPGEDEPEMKQFVENLNHYTQKTAEWERRAGETGANKLKDKDFEDMADALYGKIMDTAFRRQRHYSGTLDQAAANEANIRRAMKEGRGRNQLLPSENQKKEMVKKLKDLSPDKLKDLLKDPRSVGFQGLYVDTMTSVKKEANLAREEQARTNARQRTANRSVLREYAPANLHEPEQPQLEQPQQPHVLTRRSTLQPQQMQGRGMNLS